MKDDEYDPLSRRAIAGEESELLVLYELLNFPIDVGRIPAANAREDRTWGDIWVIGRARAATIDVKRGHGNVSISEGSIDDGEFCLYALVSHDPSGAVFVDRRRLLIELEREEWMSKPGRETRYKLARRAGSDRMDIEQLVAWLNGEDP